MKIDEDHVKKAFAITKRGGYGRKAVPETVIEEAKREVGLEEVPVKVELVPGFERPGRYQIGDEHVIRIPRREAKWAVPKTLRHEMWHIKLHSDLPRYHELREEEVPREYARRELEVLQRLRKGGLIADDLLNVAGTLVYFEGVPPTKAIDATISAAEELGVSRRIRTIARRFFWEVLDELSKEE